MKVAAGSFRDPSGQVYEDNGKILRTITESYRPHFEKAEAFLKKLAQKRLLLPFEEVTPLSGAWKTIEVERLPFVSYPYEWSYDQLKSAALLTLDLQKLALKRGLILKDASAYNVQFIGAKPIFIDHLSFEEWKEGMPWSAYKQFCTHFLTPLALIAHVDLHGELFSKLWIDGIPLETAAAMLPTHKRLNPGLHFHLFMHARMQTKHADDTQAAGKMTGARITIQYLLNLADSLKRLILSKAMRLPAAKTEWGDYYSHTNYTEAAADAKYEVVAGLAEKYASDALAIDLGANTGRYTQAIAKHFAYTIAADIDPLAVNRHYLQLRQSETDAGILPLLIDLANPSPGIGFANTERSAFKDRCSAGFIMALALIHHLRMGAGIPLAMIAEFFSTLFAAKGILVLEFVPKEDSQVQKLLATREDIYEDYTLEACQGIFAKWFDCEAVIPVEGTGRSMLVLRKKEAEGV